MEFNGASLHMDDTLMSRRAKIYRAAYPNAQIERTTCWLFACQKKRAIDVQHSDASLLDSIFSSFLNRLLISSILSITHLRRHLATGPKDKPLKLDSVRGRGQIVGPNRSG